MEKQKPWQLFVILAVVLLTIYNVLPTVLYYGRPLKESIDSQAAEKVAIKISERVNDLELQSKEWLEAFCKNLSIQAKSIAVQDFDPRLIKISFRTSKEANLFKSFLPRAGELIHFIPAQLRLSSQLTQNPETELFVERRIGLHMDPKNTSQYFTFSTKREADQSISPFYRKLVYDRVSQLALGFAGKSPQAADYHFALQNQSNHYSLETLQNLCNEMNEYVSLFGENSPITQRFLHGLASSPAPSSNSGMQAFVALLQKSVEQIQVGKDALLADQAQKAGEKFEFDPTSRAQLELLDKQISSFQQATKLIQRNETQMAQALSSYTHNHIQQLLTESEQEQERSQSAFQEISLGNHHPFVHEISIDWENEQIHVLLHPEVRKLLSSTAQTESEAYTQERLNQLIVNEVARVSRLTNENIQPIKDDYLVSLNQLTNSQSLLAINLGKIAQTHAAKVQEKLNHWTPSHKDLQADVFPIIAWENYQQLPLKQKRLALVVYAPTMFEGQHPPEGFRSNAIYVIAKGFMDILHKYEAYPESEEAIAFQEDFQQLHRTMQAEGFVGFPGSTYGLSSEFQKDFIFELNDYYSHVIKATREDFSVMGSNQYAVLELTDHEQRILTLNRIEKSIHEDLMKWRDEYQAAQVDLDLTKKHIVPPPSRSVLFSNLKLSTKKYFRGDDSKIIKWGLDLSGGKMVRIGLRDQNNQAVTDEASLKQGLNELTTRVNKMGLSEVNVRVEGQNIALDFPGSQGFSASELVKASSMFFHVVNETFSLRNSALSNEVNQFLQGVWNEAVVTNRKDVESVNEIAWRHLGADSEDMQRPISTYAKTLLEKGLRFAHPKEGTRSNAFDDTLSSIAMYRGDDLSQWRGQNHPLLIVFHNYALEGSDLENITAGYDPEKGNILSFGVQSSYSKGEHAFLSPRDSLHTWTSQFAQEKIAGTAKEEATNGEGWRMAVILNGNSISEPTLNQPLKHHAMIYGKFSQREVNRLVADLQAGSLSFTPRILSEENISPDLGKEERLRGISSALIGLFLVIATMISYYRFGGVVASFAVFLNLLIMWGVLQNLSAALTLAGIAGIILTVGMAVDANVLIFERIREEFNISGRIASAIHAGYKKAFSAIVDSNVTTIIAALILMQFDSGPIKGFAITLIIGIASSMFTALFVTRYYFAGWAQNPKNKVLNMSNLIGKSNFDFLGKRRIAYAISLLIIAVGSFFLVSQKQTMLGMDFTGGYSLTVNVDEDSTGNYRLRAEEALVAAGAANEDFQVRELNKPNHLRIQIGMSMEEEGHPFHQMPVENLSGNFTHEYQKNPRISWALGALEKGQLHIDSERLVNLDKNWTSISGQFSDVMRNNALLGLGIALFCILIYITIRFEFKYAISAIIGIAHDVFISLAALAIFHRAGLSIQVNMETIAAVMTIIGYSLNDTIIIFDRIREDTHILRKKSFHEIVNHALNTTLSRTVLTSGTTLLVLLALVVFGGSLIFDFAFVMLIGVVLGTISSWFIASPLLCYFHQREAAEVKNRRVPA